MCAVYASRTCLQLKAVGHGQLPRGAEFLVIPQPSLVQAYTGQMGWTRILSLAGLCEEEIRDRAFEDEDKEIESYSGEGDDDNNNEGGDGDDENDNDDDASYAETKDASSSKKQSGLTIYIYLAYVTCPHCVDESSRAVPSVYMLHLLLSFMPLAKSIRNVLAALFTNWPLTVDL